MTFANFIFVIFIVVSIAVFIVLALLMRQIKIDGRLPHEKMTTLAAILFIPALIVCALCFKSISNWRTDLRQEQQRIKIESFISDVYQPLANSRVELRKNLLKVQALLQHVERMISTHPNHLALTSMLKKQWSLAYASLFEVYTETDKEVRRAWIAHNTLDQQDVLLKFSKQAIQIDAKIKKAQADHQIYLHDIQGKMVEALNRSRKLLAAHQTPPKSTRQVESNQALRKGIRPINTAVSEELMSFLGTLDSRLQNDLKVLYELIRISGQQSAIIRDHLYKNRDLERPLTKIISDWKILEDKSNKSLQQIYYAIETEYIVRQLGLPSNSPAIKAMHQTLTKTIPAIKGEGLKQKKKIDQSYSINLKGL